MVFRSFRLHCRRASFLSVSRLGCATLAEFPELRWHSLYMTRFIFVFVPAGLRDVCPAACRFVVLEAIFFFFFWVPYAMVVVQLPCAYSFVAFWAVLGSDLDGVQLFRVATRFILDGVQLFRVATRFIFVFVAARLRDGCSPATLF